MIEWIEQIPLVWWQASLAFTFAWLLRAQCARLLLQANAERWRQAAEDAEENEAALRGALRQAVGAAEYAAFCDHVLQDGYYMDHGKWMEDDD